jgi:hypothetical protein
MIRRRTKPKAFKERLGMIFRLSQKLNARIDGGRLTARELSQNPFTDWSAHLFIADRSQYVLLTNTASLYSTVMYGRRISTDGRFVDQSLSSIREFMAADGQHFIYERFIAPTCGTIQFAKSLNRSVTGSMNDLVGHAIVRLTEGELSPFDVGFELNEIPFSPLQYRTPRDVFKSMTGSRCR